MAKSGNVEGYMKKIGVEALLSSFSVSPSASTSGYFWPFWLFSIRLAMWPWPGHLREFVIFFENTQNYLKNQKKTFRIY
jgi:hypothetical protein